MTLRKTLHAYWNDTSHEYTIPSEWGASSSDGTDWYADGLPLTYSEDIKLHGGPHHGKRICDRCADEAES